MIPVVTLAAILLLITGLVLLAGITVTAILSLFGPTLASVAIIATLAILTGLFARRR